MFDISCPRQRLILAGILIFACLIPKNTYGLDPTPSSSSNSAVKSEKMRQRLEQLFTWRVSDRLHLGQEEEQKFTDEFKKLSTEKSQLAQDLESILEKIEKEKDNDKVTGKLMNDYQACLKKTSDLQIKELQVMKKLFGNRRLVEYVLLKREMTQKFKDVLTQNTAQPQGAESSGTMKDPEVIQER